jgi:hypothetical protein
MPQLARLGLAPQTLTRGAAEANGNDYAAAIKARAGVATSNDCNVLLAVAWIPLTNCR